MGQHSVYTCSNCDAQTPRWVGRCAQCGKFGTVGTVPTSVTQAPRGVKAASAPAETVSLSGLATASLPRLPTGYHEFDRVLGGGLAEGSIVLLTGEPGVGKSTLVLALAARCLPAGQAGSGGALYISGEESAEQVSARLRRLGLTGEHVSFSTTVDLGAVRQTAASQRPAVVVVDSLQTVVAPGVEAPVGSPTQVRAAVAELVALAKATQSAVVVIGHVTKEGVAAGPKTVEHLVDVVLQLEGGVGSRLKVLRALKNRFGPTDEVGVFELTEGGLKEVANPSALFLSERHQGAGSAVTAVLEGSRALLIELQALVARSRFANPKRATTGFDFNRLQLLLAVLDERAGVKLAWSDVYINLAGGYRSREPALDLAVCAAVASAATKRVLPKDLVVFGEVGLGGEVRPVAGMERRLQEAARLGFKQAIIPALTRGATPPPELALVAVKSVAEAVDWVQH